MLGKTSLSLAQLAAVAHRTPLVCGAVSRLVAGSIQPPVAFETYTTCY